MTLYQILLQGTELVGRDIFVAQRTKAGSNAVERAVLLLDLPLQVIASIPDTVTHIRCQFQFHILRKYLLYTFESKRFRTYIIDIAHSYKIVLTQLSSLVSIRIASDSR